jgi:hypothetical protein
MPPTECRTRCVLLAPRGDRAPERGDAARGLLDRRGWMVHDAADPLGALAELCLLDRTQTMREAWGLQTVEALALVVAGRSDWADDLPDLVSAAARYVPQATLWCCDGEELQPVDPAARAADPRATPRAAPPTRADRGTGEDDVSPPLISGDEIAMLLDDEQQEPAP